MEKHEIKEILKLPVEELILKANIVRKKALKDKIELCSIMNAKSGMCSEDCKFCTQSSHYNTSVNIYSLKSKDEIIEESKKASINGVKRFSIVTSGNKLTKEELNIIAKSIEYIRNKLDILPCASLGAIDKKDLCMLKNAGLVRYHHNLETSERYYPYIVSTHKYEQRINTIRLAKDIGLEVCSGGIFGIGETWDDCIDMALCLKDLNIDAVPLNFLVKIKGTPLENEPKISVLDALKIISIFRIILVDKDIKIIAGRETILKDFQGMMFFSGANGIMMGGYLTTQGRLVKEDWDLINNMRRLWKEK